MRNKNKILLQQLEEKVSPFYNQRDTIIPKKGWINTIRKTLNMTLEQLGRKLGITKQGVLGLENSEANGSITLNSLKEIGNAMDMQLIYGFIPKDGNLNALIDRKAHELAMKIVSKTNQTMKLESQAINDEKLQEAISDLSEEIKREMNKSLWD